MYTTECHGKKGNQRGSISDRGDSGTLITVLPKTNQANPVLCTEIRFLNGSFQNLKMLPQPSFQISNLPLLRALKRGTV